MRKILSKRIFKYLEQLLKNNEVLIPIIIMSEESYIQLRMEHSINMIRKVFKYEKQFYSIEVPFEVEKLPSNVDYYIIDVFRR